MTAAEMQFNFQSKLQGMTTHPPYFDSYRIQTLLNEAQNIYLDKYVPLFDTSETIRKKLDTVIKQASPTINATGANNLTNGYFVTLPGNLRYTLMEWATTATTVLRVKPIKYDSYLIEKDNPFKNPDTSLVWRLDYGPGMQHELITNGSVVLTAYKLRYISNPQPIDILEEVDCQLPLKDHEEIVNIALSLVTLPSEKTN